MQPEEIYSGRTYYHALTQEQLVALNPRQWSNKRCWYFRRRDYSTVQLYCDEVLDTSTLVDTSAQDVIDRDHDQKLHVTETRIKNKTGDKGSKLAQMADTPASVLLELMEHSGKGREKYPGNDRGPNYSLGYKWSLSYNAMMRHILQFWGGEDIDAETGSKHMIAAAWHALCLAYFMDAHQDKDDRWEKP